MFSYVLVIKPLPVPLSCLLNVWEKFLFEELVLDWKELTEMHSLNVKASENHSKVWNKEYLKEVFDGFWWILLLEEGPSKGPRWAHFTIIYFTEDILLTGMIE